MRLKQGLIRTSSLIILTRIRAISLDQRETESRCCKKIGALPKCNILYQLRIREDCVYVQLSDIRVCISPSTAQTQVLYHI